MNAIGKRNHVPAGASTDKMIIPGTTKSGSEALPNPWDRQPQESHKSFAAFTIYRDLGGDRTYQEVAQKLHCSGANVRRWAAKSTWHSRAYEWDCYQDQKAQEAQIRGRIRMAERHAETGMVMQSIASAEMDKLRKSLEDIIPGKQPRNLSAKEIVRFLEVGCKIERSARGDPGIDSVAKIEVIFGDVEEAEGQTKA